MDLIRGRTVLVTGASSGIGRACARSFAERGARVVMAARREERLIELAAELTAAGAEAHMRRLDVRDRAAVGALGKELARADLLPDVLINNAGLSRGLEPLYQGDVEDWEEMIDTNVKGLLYVTRTFVPHMVECDCGHVVNIGSIAGQAVYPGGNVYAATKFAVRALTQALNVDLVGTRIRVSTVDPGMVETAFSEVRFHGDAGRAARVYRGIKALSPEDVAEAVLWVVDRPPHVDILEVVLMPTAQRNLYVIDKEES